MCAAPCGRFNAFLLSFQIEESEGTSATTVTRTSMELTGGMPSFMGGIHLLWIEIAIIS